MNINRNNYEEFFMLYADNELSAAEKQLVESFVQENPDLQQEFSLLQHTKLSADNSIVFENKELLMSSHQGNNSVINHSNYEEFFLLYVDNELNEEGRKSVEEFAAWHPSLQLELIQLQKVRFTPDNSIVFEGKEKLYKEEKKKIFIFPWQRIAAAAVVLLLAGLLVFKYTSTKHISPEVASQTKKDTQSKNIDDTKKDQQAVTSKPPDSLNNNSNAREEMALRQKKEEKKLQTDIKTEQKNKQAKNERNPLIKNLRQENDMAPVIVRAQNNDQKKQVDTDKIAMLTNAVAAVNLKTQDVPVKNPITVPEVNPVTKQVALADQDGNPENQNGFLAFSTKKNKMRGIFRKVSRVFEKTTNVDSDKPVLIGNFQIALK